MGSRASVGSCYVSTHKLSFGGGWENCKGTAARGEIRMGI